MDLPPEQMTATHRVCADCGHLEAQHYGFGWPGNTGCMAQVDRRPLTAGGDQLYPCDCKGFTTGELGSPPNPVSLGAGGGGQT